MYKDPNIPSSKPNSSKSAIGEHIASVIGLILFYAAMISLLIWWLDL